MIGFIGQQGADTTTLASATNGHTLFHYMTTKVGVNQTSPHFIDCDLQDVIIQALLFCPLSERLVFKDSHPLPS
jgi:hypothetical protein